MVALPVPPPLYRGALQVPPWKFHWKKKKIKFLGAKRKWYLRTFFFWVSFGERWRLFICPHPPPPPSLPPPPPNHWSADMKCHNSLCPHRKSSPLIFIYLFLEDMCPLTPPPPHVATLCRVVVVLFFSYSFKTELIYHLCLIFFFMQTDSWWKWFAHLWDVSCTFHVNIEPLHIWRRHVCIVVDVFLQICTYEGVWSRELCKNTNVQTTTFVQTFRPQMCKLPHLWLLCKRGALKCANR